MFHISYAAILLFGETQHQFDTVVTYGNLPIDLDLKLLTDATKLLSHPPLNNKKLLFNKLSNDNKWHKLNSEEKRCLKKIRYSPLVVQEKIIGVACLYGEAFDPAKIESQTLHLWANLASLVIQKFHRYSKIQKRLEITSQELKRAESQLIRSEKLSSLGEIAMSVAHVIRNPIAVIGGFSRRLHNKLPKNDPKRSLSEIIISEASRLECIVKEFKDFYSIDQISFQIEDINWLADKAVDEFLSGCGPRSEITIKKVLCKKPLMCSIDANLMER
jgi:signal transduction histidine kinase